MIKRPSFVLVLKRKQVKKSNKNNAQGNKTEIRNQRAYIPDTRVRTYFVFAASVGS